MQVYNQTTNRVQTLPKGTYNGRMNYQFRTESEHNADGFFYIEQTEKPEITDTQRIELSHQIQNGKAVQVWTIHDLTEAELQERKEANTPQSINPAQGRKQLREMGLFDAVNGFVANSNNPDLIDFWEYAISWQLNSPTIINIAETLQIDRFDFFINANKHQL